MLCWNHWTIVGVTKRSLVDVLKVIFFVYVWQELRGHAAETEGAVSLPARSGGRHTVPLLQSNSHLCGARPFPQCISLYVSSTACTVPRSASVFAGARNSLFAHMTTAHQMLFLCLAGVSAMSSGPWILVEDLSSVYSDVEVERGAVKHAHKKRKLADGREKTMVSLD